MKKIFLLAASVAGMAMAFTSTGCSSSQQPRQLKVLTYNIHNGTGMDGVCDYARIAEVITSTGADIVAVQEVDSATARSKGAYVLGEIANHAQYNPYFSSAIDYDGGKYGIGLLSKEEPLTIKRLPLPGREEERTLIIAEFPDYIMANAHFSLTPEDALASVPTIAAEAQTAEKPFIVAGDWNSHPDSPVLTALKDAGFMIATNVNEPTFPADSPNECIDYIAVYMPQSSNVEIISSAVEDEAVASDHRPVVATVKIAK